MQPKDFWQKEIKEIQENKFRFAGLCICFVVAAVLFLSEDDGGEEIILSENPAPVEENLDADAKIITVQNSAAPVANKNIKVALGANSDELIIYDIFKVPPKEEVETVEEIPPVIVLPPVAQVDNLKEKFVLRGTAIIGNNKTALIQKISEDKKSDAENLILGIGDNLNGKKILDIAADSVIFEDGETLHLEIR